MVRYLEIKVPQVQFKNISALSGTAHRAAWQSFAHMPGWESSCSLTSMKKDLLVNPAEQHPEGAPEAIPITRQHVRKVQENSWLTHICRMPQALSNCSAFPDQSSPHQLPLVQG